VRPIGAKSLAALGVAGAAAGLAGARGVLSATYLTRLSGASCFFVGLFAAVAAALVARGWRPDRPSRAAVAIRGGRPVIEAATAPRELPAALQRALLSLVFACIGLGAFTNQASAKLTALPETLGTPSKSEYCVDEEPQEKVAAAAPAPEPEVQGCALIKRAYKLGYAKSLGACAPKKAEAMAAPEKKDVRAPCELRQLDEPFLHYTWRLLAQRGEQLSGVAPVDYVRGGVRDFRTKLGYAGSLVAAQSQAVEATPHASHHLFTNLPAPRTQSWIESLLAPDDCAARWAALPIWPQVAGAPQAPSRLVEDVLGQLLFGHDFGPTPGNCNEHIIHWEMPADACEQLAEDPAGFLAAHGALAPVEAVLARRQSKLELRRMASALDRPPPGNPPPPADRVVSLQCLVVDPAGDGHVTSTDVVIDGETIPVRALRAPEPVPTGAGPLDVYQHLAALLAGGGYSGPTGETTIERIGLEPPAPGSLSDASFRLTRLDALVGADPFLGTRWPLDRADVVEVYPFRAHLEDFVAAFRSRYYAQRGRL